MFEGKVIDITEIKIVGKGNKETRKIIIEEVKDKHPQTLAGVLFGDKVQEYAHIGIGDIVQVEIRYSSNNYNGTWYCNNNITDLEKVGEASGSTDDDLPF